MKAKKPGIAWLFVLEMTPTAFWMSFAAIKNSRQ
jgi:hypothetical protein